MKKIPMLNYIKVFILFLLTFVIVIILANNYKEKMKFERSNQDIMSFLSTIKYDELSSYLIENRDGYIYMASSSDASLDSFKRDFKEYLLEEELEKYFLYLDSSDYSIDNFNKLKTDYFASNLNEMRIVTPNVFAIKNGKIIAALYNEDEIIKINDIKAFVNKYQVTND